MKATASAQGETGQIAAADDVLSDLRGAFNKRLRSDRRRLVTLRAMIFHRRKVAAATFDEMQFLAHRMCGAAAIFAFPVLAAAAHALLDALPARRLLEAGSEDRPPFLSLDALIELMVRMDDSPR